MVTTGTGRFGLRIYTYNNTDWVTWYKYAADRDKAYDKAKKKAGPEKTRKTPYRIVKKVQR